MFELLTQIIILVGIFFLIRFLFGVFPRPYFTWLGFIALLAVIGIAFLDPANPTAGILWGIISLPLRPLGLSLLLLSYALGRTYPVFRFWGRPAKEASFGVPQLLAAFLILLIFSLPITAYLLTAQTEQRTALEASLRPANSVQAIVVLGDGTLPTDPAYRLRTQLSNPANGLSVTLESRLLYAAQLYNNQVAQGNNPFIVVSAGPQALLVRQGVTASDAINAFLGKAGVPAEQIRIDTESVDARTSAVNVREIFLGPGSGEPECDNYAVCRNNDSISINRLPSQSEFGPVLPIILVAPAITIRRSVSTFTNLNYEVTPRATDFYVFQIQGGLRLAAITDLIPSAEALSITTRAIDEYWAWVYYFLRGWLSDPLNV